MRHFKLSAMISLALLVTSGCGQRGPLYLPQDKPEPTASSDPLVSMGMRQSINHPSIMANSVTISAAAAIREGV